MNQDGHIQLGRERVDAPKFRTGGLDVKFEFPETGSALLHGIGEEFFGPGFGNVRTGQPREETTGVFGLQRLDVFRGALARQREAFETPHPSR
jgi:hypothetical protein